MNNEEIQLKLISNDIYRRSEACFAVMEMQGMDDFLAWYYTEHSYLLSIPNAQGHYPLWEAYRHQLFNTLMAIVESDQSPQDAHGSLISSLVITPQEPSLEVFFTEEMDKENDFDRKVMHAMLPHLRERDQLELADALFAKLTPIRNLDGLAQLIDEDFNLKHSIMYEDDDGVEEEGMFVDVYVNHLINNGHLDVRALLSLKGMCFTPGVVNRLTYHLHSMPESDDKKLLSTFATFIRKLLSYQISLDWFTKAFEYLRGHNIDIRNYRFNQGENVIQLICCLVNGGPFLDYLDAWPKITERATGSPMLLQYSAQDNPPVVAQSSVTLTAGHTFIV